MSSERRLGLELRALAGEALRSGTLAGLATIPFAALFRAFGLRINEHGRKTLALVVGDVAPPLHNGSRSPSISSSAGSWRSPCYGCPRESTTTAPALVPSLAIHLVYGLVIG
jgi:hypothetical protein